MALGVRLRFVAAAGITLLIAACSPEPAPPQQAPPPRTAPAASPSPDHSAFVAAVDAVAAEALARGPIGGLSIAVQARGREVLAKGYGFANVETKEPATADTSYPIASVSKRLTAAAILRIVDEGRIALDDPLSRFFPEAAPPIGALTVRHLLQHTSGLTRGGPAPRRAALSVLARGGTGRPQGQDWTYSNYNYSLLGLLLERVSGHDYATHVAQELAAPLGLGGTAYCEDGRPVPGRTTDYLSTPRSLSATTYWADAHFFSAGGLCSTVRDLVRFEKALADGRVVSKGLLAEMQSPARLSSGFLVGYGFGTRMGYTGGRRKIGHTGGGQGNKAVLARYPDEDVTVVVLTNTERDDAPVTAMDIEDRVERLFFGITDPTAAPDVTAANRVQGTYQSGAARLHVRAAGGAIVVGPAISRAQGKRFVPLDGERFVSEDDQGVELRFFEEGGGGYRRYHRGWFNGYAVRTGP